MILCWDTFIAILRRMSPRGHRLDTPAGLPQSRIVVLSSSCCHAELSVKEPDYLPATLPWNGHREFFKKSNIFKLREKEQYNSRNLGHLGHLLMKIIFASGPAQAWAHVHFLLMMKCYTIQQPHCFVGSTIVHGGLPRSHGKMVARGQAFILRLCGKPKTVFQKKKKKENSYLHRMA